MADILHVSDFTRDEKQIVIDLINHDNSIGSGEPDAHCCALTLETVELGLPFASATAEEDERNTDIEVSAIEGSGYSGSVTVSYNRLLIQEFVPLRIESGELKFPVGDAMMFADMVPEINIALGINLTADSYEDGEIGEWQGIPNETKEIVIPMSADNPVYIGSLTLTLMAEDLPLSSVITNLVLMGLNLPESTVGEGEDEVLEP